MKWLFRRGLNIVVQPWLWNLHLSSLYITAATLFRNENRIRPREMPPGFLANPVVIVLYILYYNTAGGGGNFSFFQRAGAGETGSALWFRALFPQLYPMVPCSQFCHAVHGSESDKPRETGHYGRLVGVLACMGVPGSKLGDSGFLRWVVCSWSMNTVSGGL